MQPETQAQPSPVTALQRTEVRAAEEASHFNVQGRSLARWSRREGSTNGFYIAVSG
jgi:hypothetical protein